MKRFCTLEMRKEYRGVTQIAFNALVFTLMAFAVLGIGMQVMGVDIRLRLIAVALNPIAVLAFIGAYYILTDEKNLIRNTPFGQSLSALGEPRDVMRQIDESALKRYEFYGVFILLEDWLILYYANGWKYDRNRTCAVPIPRDSIRAVEVLPEYDPKDPKKRTIRLVTEDGISREFEIYQQQAVEALRDWLKEQEQKT